MRRAKRILCLAVFVPLYATLGSILTLDGRGEPWSGLIVGGLIGLFFGFFLGGAWASRSMTEETHLQESLWKGASSGRHRDVREQDA
jgi:hypothetical protein